MTLRLILTRHAKSSWDDPLQDDHDRVLNKRGERDAATMGKWLMENDFIPAEVVSSTAARTLQTWDIIATALPDTALMRRDPSLYHASADRMAKVLSDCAASPVMMIGHNPGISDFARLLLANAPDHGRFRDYPTCSTLVADFDITDWADLSFGKGQVVAFSTPRDHDA